jgi:hypothetical protein
MFCCVCPYVLYLYDLSTSDCHSNSWIHGTYINMYVNIKLTSCQSKDCWSPIVIIIHSFVFSVCMNHQNGCVLKSNVLLNTSFFKLETFTMVNAMKRSWPYQFGINFLCFGDCLKKFGKLYVLPWLINQEDCIATLAILFMGSCWY